MNKRTVVISVAMMMLAAVAAWADGGFVDVEMGAAFTGYNDVRIPSETGDTISLATDTNSEPALAYRLHRAGTNFVPP